VKFGIIEINVFLRMGEWILWRSLLWLKGNLGLGLQSRKDWQTSLIRIGGWIPCVE